MTFPDFDLDATDLGGTLAWEENRQIIATEPSRRSSHPKRWFSLNSGLGIIVNLPRCKPTDVWHFDSF